MPKFPKAFARRKSTANAFDEVQGPSVGQQQGSVSSFKVFERPDGGSKSFDGGVKLAKASGAHLYPPGTPRMAAKEENMFEGLVTANRGSGASNSNTASTTDNSSRLSAASTAPSSTDTKNEEWKSPHDRPYSDIPVPPMPKSQSAFSLRNAGRTLSWGRSNRNTTPPPPPLPKDLPQSEPSLSVADEFSPRARAVTASSYASTATPPKLDDRDLGLSLGGDFGDMFSGFGKRKSAVLLDTQNSRSMSSSPELLPTGPATRPSAARPTHLSPVNTDRNQRVEPSQYSWGSNRSNEGLMSGSSPPPLSPSNDTAPKHNTPTSYNPQARKRVASGDSGLRRNSAYSGRRQSLIGLDVMDQDAKLLRESLVASRKLNDPSYLPKVRDSWALPSNSKSAFKVDDATVANWTRGHSENTPKAKGAQPSTVKEENLFDDQISETAMLGQKFAEGTPSPPPEKEAPQPKVMTPAQFERYRQDKERIRSVGEQSKEVEEDEDEDEPYDDEEDELERKKEIAKQRRKQEAHMAVYRQQMMKVTGETPSTSVSSQNSGLSRPGLFGAHSTPNLMSLGVPEEGEEEDEEIPLAILQAHGFPAKGKPPIRASGSNPNLRAASALGGALPVFARNLPEDPYYGAGLVNPSHRESMAFGGGSPNGSPRVGPQAGIPQGIPPVGLPPGGLVGVIATEERSRAMRRGSPNPQGNFGPSADLNGMGMGMQPSPSMMNGFNGMPMPMPMMMDPAQMQMNAQMQQMQHFMQMQMQFMQMMSQGQGQNGQLPVPGQEFQRPNSAHGGAPQLRPISSHQRAMTMMDPNSAPWLQPGGGYTPSINGGGLGLGGYAPSIAPSERSNVGLPGRYRPVSQVPLVDNKSRASTMSGALQGWENKNGQTTVKTVAKKPESVSDDDDEGWEQMKKAKEKKKSMWRIKKDTTTNALKDMAAFMH